MKHKVLFDPAEANHFLSLRLGLFCFPPKLERQPSERQNFEAQSHSLFPRCLRLAAAITDDHSRLATGGWLDLARQASHLLDYSPFVWAHNSDLSNRLYNLLHSLESYSIILSSHHDTSF